MSTYRLALSICFLYGLCWAWSTSVLAGQGSKEPGEQKTILAEIRDLKARIEALEKELLGGSEADEGAPGEGVDLSVKELPSLLPAPNGGGSFFEGPWYRNVDISGFGAMGYLDSGDDGARPNGGFLIKESSLFVEAFLSQGVSLFFEIQVNRLGNDSSRFVRTGEVNAHFRNVLKRWGNDLLSVKVGRVDIPFGEEYLWQDAPDNPLISNSAAYPYGTDEGVVIYGSLRGLGWIASVTDGALFRSVEDHPDKALNLKFFGRPVKPLYLSASFMSNGSTARSAFQFGGSFIQPVGASHVSTLGDSPSAFVNAHLYQLNAKVDFGTRAYIAGSFGQALVDDPENPFDRDFTWFSLEPSFRISPVVYAVVRYSEIGTYDFREGYHFDGKTTAGGNGFFGYDTRRLQRLSVGIGWQPGPNVLLKGELGHDWFEVIDVSPFNPTADDRLLSGLELVLKF